MCSFTKKEKTVHHQRDEKGKGGFAPMANEGRKGKRGFNANANEGRRRPAAAAVVRAPGPPTRATDRSGRARSPRTGGVADGLNKTKKTLEFSHSTQQQTRTLV